MNNFYLVIHFGSRIHAIAQWSVSFLGDRCAIEDVRLLHSLFAFCQFRHLRFLLLHYSLHFSLAFCWLWLWVFGGYFLWKMIPRLVRRNPRLRTDPRADQRFPIVIVFFNNWYQGNNLHIWDFLEPVDHCRIALNYTSCSSFGVCREP